MIISWVFSLYYVVFVAQENVFFLQRIVIVAHCRHGCIQQTAIVPCALCTSTPVTALHLNIICTVFPIHCQNIQSD